MQRPFEFNKPISVDTTILRNVMTQVYLWMTIALLTTAATALASVSSGFTETIAASPLFLVALLIEIGLVFFLQARINKMAVGQAIGLFFLYAALNGVTLSIILLIYTAGSVVTAFVSCAAIFAAMSILGYTTETDLSSIGKFLIMGVIGLLVAMIVNFFVGSPAIDYLISIAGVLIFTGLAAYNTQRVKQLAKSVENADNNAVTRVSIIGALILYLNFINLFLFMLRLFGRRR